MKRFKWNEDTIEYFRTRGMILSDQVLWSEMKMFVVDNCDLEDGESYEDLLVDLLHQVQSKYE